MNDTAKKARGSVVVRDDTCKGCAFCIEFCPSDCLQFSAGFNPKGYHFPVLTDPLACSGCNLCGLYCPDFAIFGYKFSDLEAKATAAACVPA